MHAQTGGSDTIANRTHQIDEVVVTESRRQHALKSTAPTHVLSQEDMLQMGISDMASALHRLPGITLRDYGGAGGMKTVSVRGFGAKHTGVSYDGITLSECQSGEIDLSRYSLDNVGHLQLTIGDNSDIFLPARQAATPALLSINSLQPPTLPADGVSRASRPHLTAQFRAGSFGYVSPLVKYEQQYSARLSLQAVAEFIHARNDYPFTLTNITLKTRERRNNSRMNQGHGELNLSWRPTPQSLLTSKLYYYDNDRQLPGQVRYYTNVSHETLRDRSAFAQLVFQTHWGEQLSLKWHGKFNWNASYYDDGLKASQIDDANYWQRETYTSVALLYTPSRHWALDYSADYAFNNLNSTLRTDVRPYRHTVLQTATAKYQGRRLTGIARLLASVYHNGAEAGASTGDASRLSPSVSLSYALASGLHVRASYKNIFRVPTFNESYYFHFGSSELSPELTDQLNLGATLATTLWGQTAFSATLDGYYNHVKDMIVAVPYNMFVWTCVNVGRVRVLGLDATLHLSRRLGRHTLTASGNYSFQQAENRTNPASPYYGNQIAYMPRYTGAASLGWENPWVSLVLNGQGISSRWTNNEHLTGTRVDGYTELGAAVYHTFRLRQATLELRLDVRNLTDRQYEIVRLYPMPGRNWLATLKCSY